MNRKVGLTIDEVKGLVSQQLTDISDHLLVNAITPLLVEPYAVERAWDYGKPGERFECWTVLEHPESNSGIAYCQQGFGPDYGWGLVFLTGPHMGIGMDSGWHISLEHAFRNCMAWHGPNPEGYEIP